MGKERSFLSAPNVVNKILSTTASPVTSHNVKGMYVWFQGVTGSVRYAKEGSQPR